MKPQFEEFTKELIDYFFEWECADIDGGHLQDLAQKHGVIKEVPASDEYKEDYGEECETMFVRNYEGEAE